MSNVDWTSKLREQLADYQEPVNHDLWASIEQSLAQEPAKKAQVISIRRWMATAAAIALLGVGGGYVYLHQEDVNQGNSVLASLPASKKLQASSHPIISRDAQSSVSALADASLLKHAAKSHLPLAGVALDRKTTVDETYGKEGMVAAECQTTEPAEMEAQSAKPAEKEKSPQNRAYASSSALASQDAYHFHKDEGETGWSLRLYAENMTPSMGGMSNSNSYYSESNVMLDPAPGVIADPTVAGIHGEDYLLASYKAILKSRKGEAKHHAPVSVGLQVGVDIAPHLSLSTGFVYTRVTSDFKSYMSNNYNIHQVLHYVGIPVGLNYEFWQGGGFHAYVMAGAEADYNVKNDTDEDGAKKEDVERDRIQFSGKASLGAQYDITPKVGLYIEPGAKYYFDNGSDVENTFKDKKLNFNLQFGLRLNL